MKEDGSVVSVSPEEVAKGDVILVKPGERIPLDGVVIEGTSSPEYRRADRRVRSP